MIAQLVAAIDAGDAGAITSAGLALIDKIKDAVQGIASVAGALDALATSFAGLTPAQRDELRAFAQAFAERVMGHLLFDYVERRFRPAFVTLFAAGAIELVDVAGGPAGSLAAAHQRKVVHFDRILRLVTDPLGLLRDVYRWGAADFDGLALFRMLKSLLDSTLGISAELLQPPGMPATLEAIAFSATVDPTAPVPCLAISLRAALDGSATQSFSDAEWTLDASTSAHLAADTDLTLRPPFDVQLQIPTGSVDAALSADVHRVASAAPFVLFGQTGGSRLEVADLTAGVTFTGHWSAGGAPVSLIPGLRAAVRGGNWS